MPKDVYKRQDIKGLLIFVHGMGGGHLSYTTEINYFANQGFLVFAYDNTGTMLSDGKRLNGFEQSIIDLQAALQYIDADTTLRQYPKVLVGHSWGAYSVCNITRFYNDIKGIVAISAFCKPSQILCQLTQTQTHKKLFFLAPFFHMVSWLRFRKRSNANVITALRQSKIPTLLFHGELDTTVPLSCSPLAHATQLKKQPNISLILCKNRYHCLLYTSRCV